MTSDELKRALSKFADQELGQNLEREALTIANDLRNLVRDRVQTSGYGPDGRPFAPYTPDYARSRKRSGYQIRRVDYTRSGRLWASIIAEVEEKTADSVTVAIGPRNEENRRKLRGPGTLAARKDGVKRGLPTLPNQKELRDVFADWTRGFFDRFENSLR